jgi:transposase
LKERATGGTTNCSGRPVDRRLILAASGCVPNRKDPICFSPYLYRARGLIERFFNKIKQRRRVAIRYDKLAANYLAFVKLASIRIWLRANEAEP